MLVAMVFNSNNTHIIIQKYFFYNMAGSPLKILAVNFQTDLRFKNKKKIKKPF